MTYKERLLLDALRSMVETQRDLIRTLAEYMDTAEKDKGEGVEIGRGLSKEWDGIPTSTFVVPSYPPAGHQGNTTGVPMTPGGTNVSSTDHGGFDVEKAAQVAATESKIKHGTGPRETDTDIPF